MSKIISGFPDLFIFYFLLEQKHYYFFINQRDWKSGAVQTKKDLTQLQNVLHVSLLYCPAFLFAERCGDLK